MCQLASWEKLTSYAAHIKIFSTGVQALTYLTIPYGYSSKYVPQPS